MNYNDIKDMTNEEAVAYFAPLTLSHVPCSDLENLLGWSGLANRNAVTSAWEGSLIDFMNSNTVPALSAGLGELFSHLNKPRSIGCDTHEQPWGSKMADLLGGLEAVGQIDASFTLSVVTLAGGYANDGIDTVAVQSLRDEEAQRVLEEAARASFDTNKERYNELYNAHIAPLAIDSNATEANWVSALAEMSANFIQA